MGEPGGSAGGGAVGVEAAELYALHRARVQRYLLGVLGCQHAAEDALQETYCRALGSLQGGFRPESPLAWLLTIARNLCISGFRAQRAVVTLEAVAELPSPHEPSHVELMTLSRALAALPDAQRRTVVLREWCGLSYGEIADVLGVSYSAVATNVFRGRNALAARLSDGSRGRPSAGVTRTGEATPAARAAG